MFNGDHTHSLGVDHTIRHDHTVVIGVDPVVTGGDRSMPVVVVPAVPASPDVASIAVFRMVPGYIMPWSDKENLPVGWESVGELGGRITENPGDPISPIVSGVWIRKV